MGRNLTSGGPTPDSFHGHSHSHDQTRHCRQVNRASTSVGFLHRSSEVSFITPHLSSFCYLWRFFPVQRTYATHPCKLLWSKAILTFLKLFLFSGSSLLQISSMFLTLFISCINLSETAKGCWECDRYYSPVPLFFLVFFSSLISFCCKQHLCTLDKFNNHDSIRNPYWAILCFILPIKIST